MHRCDFRLLVRVLAAAALPLMGAATLAGCSGASQHQVKTSGAAVAVVARPVFTAEDGSGFVPVIDSSVALDGGEAVVELEDGLWALCLDEGDKARAKLVRVDSASDATAVVEL